MPHQQVNQWTPMRNIIIGNGVDHFSYKPVAAVAETTAEQPNFDLSYKRKSFSQTYFGGLKLTLRAFAFAALAVFIVNVTWLIWAKKRFGAVSGYGTIQQGDCNAAKQLNLWLHLAINILSTLLLAGSNAFMQAFSAPTREEIDRAHYRRKWLHIGVLSFRNLLGVSKKKALVCLILALSSIPFHLL
jgi:hypothetical protein